MPTRRDPLPSWPLLELWRRVRETLGALPVHFRSDTHIEGIGATEIFTLSAALGAAIENQVVDTLNQLRSVWDPDDKHPTFSFVRQPQSFPDVVLMDATTQGGRRPAFGIELKGWYLLAKEGEPSFRFLQTPAACAPADLIVVVPWCLGNVISGRPRVFVPYLEHAIYAAEFRNYHWQYKRTADGSTTINQPVNAKPYPSKSDSTNDEAEGDKGGNFGRFARCGLMDVYLERLKKQLLCGIEACHWLDFFKIFQEHSSEDEIRRALTRLRAKVVETKTADASARQMTILRILEDLEQLIEQG